MSYKKINDKSWILEVQENGKTKELFIEFPPGALDQVGWDEGDDLIWEELPNGDWSIRKKDKDEDDPLEGIESDGC